MNLLVTETSNGVSIYNSDNVGQSCYISIHENGCSRNDIVNAYCDILGVAPFVYDDSRDSVVEMLAAIGRQNIAMEVGDSLCLLNSEGRLMSEVRRDDLFLSAISVLFTEVSDAERILGRRPMTERQALKLKRFLVNMFSTATRRVDSFCSPFWGSANLERINVVDTLESLDLYKVWSVSIDAQNSIKSSLLTELAVMVRDFGLTTENCVVALTNFYLRDAFEELFD